MKNILIIAFLFISFSFKHPYYLSVTDLKYNSKEKALQGFVKIFTNDLEAALKKKHQKPVDLINAKDKEATKNILSAYLSERLLIWVNQKKMNMELVGFEQEQESTMIYVEISGCPAPKSVKIENSILYDHLKGQNNIVHVEVQGLKKSFKVSNPDKLINFGF